MFLEDEQKALLAKFVEAHRSAPPECRGDFFASETMGDPQASFIHSRVQRLGFKGSRADAEVLARVGLLGMSWGSRGTPMFYVLPEGIAAYEQMMVDVSPVEAVESDIMTYLSDASFKKNHPAAYSKWEQAALLLRSADSGAQLTTIGHLCREAQQAFAESLSAQHNVDVSTIEPAKTVARLKAVGGPFSRTWSHQGVVSRSVASILGYSGRPGAAPGTWRTARGYSPCVGGRPARCVSDLRRHV